ncbi:hypothetical protein D9615_001242 [Tricholomella constricta]|uniref:BRCA2 OB1 domain-containing protein n=1 Tax=Tricholomella constricta TaxID=117010 RepID=A0A8H5HLU6_9AGAR|nr:hypothetical protein D9615_001242 [Tricholomella constricta]
MRSPDSPLSSPIRKRQRLSSPTYDEQLGDLSQADIDAFDKIEAQLSQSPRKGSSQVKACRRNLQHASSGHSNISEQKKALPLADDPDNPFTTGFASAKFTNAAFSTTSSVPIPGFLKASSMHNDSMMGSFQALDRSPSPQEEDLDAWFKPTEAIHPVAFQTASVALDSTETPAFFGFAKASSHGLIAPSSAAFAKAQAKMEQIWREVDQSPEKSLGSSSSTPAAADAETVFRPASTPSLQHSPRRPALQSVGNSINTFGFNSPGTPTPLGHNRGTGIPHKAAVTLTPTELLISKNSKPFKSPLLAKKPITTNADFSGSPLKPSSRFSGFSTARSQHPLASAPITANSTSISTPSLPLMATPARHPRVSAAGSTVRRHSPAPFVTPFKPGMKPGQPGRLKLLEEAFKASQLQQLVTPDKRKADWLTQERPGDKAGRASRTGVFDLTPPPNRQTLASLGLLPQQYTIDELESMGINFKELSQITPKLAMYYSFHTPTATPLYPLTSSPPVVLGSAQALDALLDNGCSLATKPWVDNHWGLILWKLAGMVGLEPQRESIPNQKRWCWAEVMRQLFYRYEREINRAKRPPLRLITTHDAPAAYPMVLCVSDITWITGGYADDGGPLKSRPELEVTDGWYRLRAQVDAPLARAIKRGLIRIGRKLTVAGAYLSSERKDPSEVLEAYNSVKLVISGNSSHLAPWHAKLGFSPGPCISTLHSLTPDGGMVAAMDIVVVKTHPIAYIEFIEDENGLQNREGPMNANEEATAHRNWKKRYEFEMSKLRAELEKKWDRYEGYIERLERRAGIEEFRPSQDDFPLDVIESMYDELEDLAEAPNVLKGLGKTESGLLARYIRGRLDKDKAHAGEDMESELKHICPPRNVRNFRIIVVQDARTQMRTGHRKALLNVWDVLNLSFFEGGSPGSFEIGQRFMVTNLKPTHQNSWMDREPGSEVYLCTIQSSRWTPLKT